MAHQEDVSGGRIAIGIGCRAGASAENIAALVQRTLDRAGLNSADAALFSIDAKRDEMGLIEAARLLAIPIRFLSRDQLAPRAGDAASRSERVQALFELPSIAETAALVGAGDGSRLVVPRVSAEAVTCAIAVATG